MTETRTAIANGSKSFFLASLFFPPGTRADVWKLYHWCRHCDDLIDNAHAGQAELGLTHIRSQTLAALDGQSAEPVFSELGSICRIHSIDRDLPLELLKGFSKDVGGANYLSLDEVEEYAYQVAGVIGVIMSSIMGVKSIEARRHAIAMGNAMQLTNIARDVAEDFIKGRIYLPRQWLEEKGVDSSRLLAPENRASVFSVIIRLLDRADVLYREGYLGLRYLPLRAAIAVGAAGEIYSRIGAKIRRQGPDALATRVCVSGSEKTLLAMKGLWRAVRSRW